MPINIPQSSVSIGVSQKLFGAFYGNGLYGMSEYGITSGASSAVSNQGKSPVNIGVITKS